MRRIYFFIAISLISFSGFARQPERGYRGFAEWANDVKLDIAIYGGPTHSKFYTGVALSQGYQFNPYLYVGGGIMVEQCIDKGDLEDDNKLFSAPFFADVRTDLKFGKFTPFIDARIGYNFSNYGGVYFSPTIGYRISVYRKIGINISLGYSLTGNRNYIEKTVDDESWGTVTTYRRSHQYNNCLTFRVGFDF